VPKLPRVSAQKLLRALQKAGFIVDRQKGSHVTLVNRGTDRRATVPMHGGTLSVGLTRAIIRQAGILPDELRDLLG